MKKPKTDGDAAEPMLIAAQDVERVYGLTRRQMKRKVISGELSHVHPSGAKGPCYLLRAEIDALIAASTTRAKRN